MTHRQQAAAFLGIVFFLGLMCQWFIIAAIGTVHTPVMFLLMWIPGLAAVGCSYLFGNGFHDLGLRLVLPKYWVLAYSVPATVALLILAVGVGLGINQFAFGGSLQVMKMLIFQPTLGVLIVALASAGAELGWRGFLYSHVRAAGIPAPQLFTGVLWAVWHWPLVAFSDYTNSKLPLLSLFLFTLSMTAFGVFLGWLRDRSRSVFPCVLAHAVHVAWMRDLTGALYKAGPLDPYFGGEAGFVMAIAYILIAAYLIQREENFLQV